MGERFHDGFKLLSMRRLSYVNDYPRIYSLGLSWAVKKPVLQQISLAQLLFQSTVASKHNNPQGKPVVFPESRMHCAADRSDFLATYRRPAEQNRINQMLSQPRIFISPGLSRATGYSSKINARALNRGIDF